MFGIRIYVEDIVTGECRSIHRIVTKDSEQKVREEIIKSLGKNERVCKVDF